MTSPHQIVFLTGDLLFFSRLRGVSESLSCSVALCSSISDLQRSLSETPTAVLIVDLETPGLRIADLMQNLPDAQQPVVIAYAPHVHERRLEDAREAGCDHVLSRGQFDRQITDLLQSLVRGEAD